MVREELIKALSDLKDYHMIPQKICDKLNLTIYQEDNPYNAGADSRMSEMFDYVSPHEKDFLMYIERVSFAIIANLARCNLCVPTEEQMLKMLKIGGYTSEEMREYIHDDIEWRCSCISAKRLAPAVCLLARVLSETMKDKSEWQGYRKGRKRKNYTPVPNQSMEKLNRLVEFMEENHLLYLDKSDEAEYEQYVVNHARFLCRIVCNRGEMQVVYDAIKQRQHKFIEDVMMEIEDLNKKRKKSSHLTAPADVPAPCDIAAMLPRTGNRFLQKQMANFRIPVNMSPEVSSIFVRMKQFDHEADALQEECWEEYDRLLEENSAEREAYVPEESMGSVAMGAFVAILSGDKLYKLKLGRMILEDMLSLGEMPLTGSFMAELEDEDEWDYLCPESNGRLALPVIKKGDCFSFSSPKNREPVQVTLPVSALLSKYAERPLKAPLYIRKSLVKTFREYGCSERKARDYAIIVATLQQVARQEREDARYMITYPAERREEILPEVTVEERVQAEIRIRENAERELRQARKENQACRHEIRILQQEIERLKGRIAKKEQREEKSGETAEEDAREKTGTAAAYVAQYPYRTSLRVVLYGGFEEFHRKLLKYLPDVRVVAPSAHIDINPFRNADIVFLQINKTDHSGYWTVCDACKSNGVPYLHLNYASAKRCAEMMVDQIRKMEKKDRALLEKNLREKQGNEKGCFA